MDPPADGGRAPGRAVARCLAWIGARLATAIAMLPGIAAAGCEGPAPDTLGPAAGRLAPCFDRANCVNTGDGYPEGISPLWLDTSTSDVFARATQVVAGMPRVRVVTVTEAYLHAEARSRVFRFVDDLAFRLFSRVDLAPPAAPPPARGGRPAS